MAFARLRRRTFVRGPPAGRGGRIIGGARSPAEGRSAARRTDRECAALGTSKILRIQPFGQLPGRCAARDDPDALRADRAQAPPPGASGPRASSPRPPSSARSSRPPRRATPSLTGDAAGHLPHRRAAARRRRRPVGGRRPLRGRPGAVLGKSRQVARLSDGSGARHEFFARGSKGWPTCSASASRPRGAPGRHRRRELAPQRLRGPAARRRPRGARRRAGSLRPGRPRPQGPPQPPVPPRRSLYPESFTGAWRAMVLAGGVWLERPRRPAIRRRGVARLAGGALAGARAARRRGDPPAPAAHRRRRPPGDLAPARAGDACALLANGPGATRLEGTSSSSRPSSG